MDTSPSDQYSPAGSSWIRLDQTAVLLAFGALGFCGSISGTLVPAVRQAFGLGLSAAMSVQWIALIGVGLSSLPLARLMQRIGTVRMAIAALAMSFFGCIAVAIVMTPTIVGAPGYALLLLSLLILSIGGTALQVSINPLVAGLGPTRLAASRMTLAQGFNSLGTLAAVYLSSVMVLARVDRATVSSSGPLLAGIAQTYLICALFTGGVLLLAVFAFRPGNQVLASPTAKHSHSITRTLRDRWALGGSLAIAAYVGAEGAIGAMVTSFLHQPDVMDLPLQTAGYYFAAIYLGGMIAGRFMGGVLLRARQPSRVLASAAVAAAAGCLVAIVGHGEITGIAVLLIGSLNSIMFPVIFSLSLERSDAPAAAVSGLLVLATSGGATVSALAGAVADHRGIGLAFSIPLCAYLIVAGFAVRAARRY
ncbi:MFS transporter [Novosphingobium sp.]|uniref:MFS transporter n=1 Tax=Novosphingobium sp. TaxID=1874826 RepID=UPI0025E8F866|nr:MFS transporter [Novosphingobium sp.]